jgi:hypothetical protein
MAVVDAAAEQRWDREQTLLGLARDTPDEHFATGGLGTLAVEPTARIVVLPGDPSAQPVPAAAPKTIIPQAIMLPRDQQLPHHSIVRGTSSGFVGYTPSGGDGRWRSFTAVHWHGGVDFYLGTEGGHDLQPVPGPRRRVVFLLNCVGWAWGAFRLQREIIDKFGVPGPFRAILGVADTAGAFLTTLGAGWDNRWSASIYSIYSDETALESRVLLLEDLAEWPDEEGAEELALRFGARLDLAFGGTGERHLDKTGPAPGTFTPRW